MACYADLRVCGTLPDAERVHAGECVIDDLGDRKIVQPVCAPSIELWRAVDHPEQIRVHLGHKMFAVDHDRVDVELRPIKVLLYDDRPVLKAEDRRTPEDLRGVGFYACKRPHQPDQVTARAVRRL